MSKLKKYYCKLPFRYYNYSKHKYIQVEINNIRYVKGNDFLGSLVLGTGVSNYKDNFIISKKDFDKYFVFDIVVNKRIRIL